MPFSPISRRRLGAGLGLGWCPSLVIISSDRSAAEARGEEISRPISVVLLVSAYSAVLVVMVCNGFAGGRVSCDYSGRGVRRSTARARPRQAVAMRKRPFSGGRTTSRDANAMGGRLVCPSR